MKLPESDINIEASNELTSYNFNLDDADQGLIFEMLRKKIYSDPIGTIVREIASNARDANRENGKEDIPIDIELIEPNALINNSEYKIKFSDSGLGISPKRMEEIFVKYGKSTKRHTNSFTGGYGIGGKTPFSYKDVFNIETIFEGYLYSYIAFIDESKRGKIQLQSKEETNLESGSSIIIPISNEDVSSFEYKCSYFTKLWDVKPNYKNFSISTEKDIYFENEKCIILNKNYGDNYNSYNVLIDGIPYPIDSNKKEVNIVNNWSAQDKYIFFKFNNGDLETSTNRETLHYSKKTIDNINNVYEYMVNFFRSEVENNISKSKNYKEACLNFYETIGSNFLSSDDKYNYFYNWLNRENKKSSLKYKNEQLLTQFYLNTYTLHHRQFDTLTPLSGGYHVSISINVIKDINEVYEVTKRYSSKKSTYIKETKYPTSTLYLLKDFSSANIKGYKSIEKRKKYLEDFKENRKKDIELLKKLGINIIDIESIDVPKEKRKKSPKRDFNEIAFKEGKNYSSYSKSASFKYYKSNNTIDYVGNIIYIGIDSLNKVGHYYRENNENIRKANVIISIFDEYKDYSIIFINKKNEEKLKNVKNTLNFKDFIKDVEKTYLGIDKLNSYLSIYNQYSLFKRNGLKVFDKSKQKKSEKIYKKINKLKVLKPKLFNHLENISYDQIKNNDLKKTFYFFLNVKNTYPLLKNVSTWSYNQYKNDINTYMEAIESKKVKQIKTNNK